MSQPNPYQQQPYGQPQYYAPYPQQGPYAPYPQVPYYAQPDNGAGTGALVFGLLGLLFAPLGLLAIILGAIGVGKANRRQATNGGQATAGLILGIVDLLFMLALLPMLLL